MPLGKSQQRLGNLTKEVINFPKHLTPEIVHTALYIHNAPREEIKSRAEYCAKQIGDKAMAFAMALLILPWLMEQGKDSQLYKDFLRNRKKTIN